MSRRDKFVKVKWMRGCETGSLMVDCASQNSCIARYFKNAKGTWTALDKTFSRPDLAEKAIERAFVWKGESL